MASVATRGAWTCEPCKRRKVKCDRSDPCLNCRRRQETCEWAGNARPEADWSVTAGRHQENIEDLKTRIQRIEAVLEKSGLVLSTPIDHASTRSGNASVGGRLAPDRQTQTVQEQPVAIDELVDATPNDSGQSHVNLHDGFDHHIIASSRNETVHQVPITVRATQLLQRVLPQRHRCDDLLENYLLRVEWIHHPLDVVQFRAQYLEFWVAFAGDEPQIPSLQWTALLLIVLCLGSHFHARGSALDLEEELYDASHEMLRLSDYLAHHSTTTIQTLISMGLWLNSRGLSNTHHVQLATAIKMAYTLRLNRVDPKVYTRPSSGPSDEAFFSIEQDDLSVVPVQRNSQLELQRRLFWSLICQDYYTASSCNFTYSIHPGQCKTRLFLNLDDEDLNMDDLPDSRPANLGVKEHATASTYQLLKIPFARIPKAVTDLYNNDTLTYPAVLDLEQQLRALYDDLPEYFKWQSPPGKLLPFPASPHVDLNHLEWQRIFLGFTLHNRVLRLHRPFMARGYVDVAMAHSKAVTVDSAIACLELAEYGEQIGFPGLRWWVILIHMFTAGVALSVDLHFLLQGQSRHNGVQTGNGQKRMNIHTATGIETIELRRRQIRHVIRLLRPSADSSVAAAQAVAVIEDLVKQAEQISSSPHAVRQEPASKRRRVDAPYASDMPSAGTDGISNRQAAEDASLGMVQPISDTTWPDLDMPGPDWWGPDWDQILASFPQDQFAMTVGEETELMETLNSFANGFTWS